MSNVLDKVAKSVQGPMKNDLRNIYLAPHRAEAETAIDVFVEKYHVKYERAVECLIKDRHALLAFFDFLLSTGSTYAARTRSRAPSPRCATERCGPRDRCRNKPRS